MSCLGCASVVSGYFNWLISVFDKSNIMLPRLRRDQMHLILALNRIFSTSRKSTRANSVKTVAPSLVLSRLWSFLIIHQLTNVILKMITILKELKMNRLYLKIFLIEPRKFKNFRQGPARVHYQNLTKRLMNHFQVAYIADQSSNSSFWYTWHPAMIYGFSSSY